MWHGSVGDFSVCGLCQRSWRSQQGQGAQTGSCLSYLHFAFPNEAWTPRGAQTLLVNVSSSGESQAEPRRTTNKQPLSNDCVRSGAGLNVPKSLELQLVWPPTLTAPHSPAVTLQPQTTGSLHWWVHEAQGLCDTSLLPHFVWRKVHLA